MRNYFAMQFAVFVYVIVMYVKMPPNNFSDEIKKKSDLKSWISNISRHMSQRQVNNLAVAEPVSTFFLPLMYGATLTTLMKQTA